jgi:PAS domain S-box-containing protein
MERSARVLLVEPDSDSRDRTVQALQREHPGVAISEITTVEDAIEQAESATVDWVVSAFGLPDGNGLELLGGLRDRNISVRFILFPENGSEDLAQDAFEAGVADYIPKADGAYTTLSHRINPGGETGTMDELERERERFSDLFENFPEPTIAYGFEDGATVFRSLNDAFEAVFGLAETEVRDTPVNNKIVPEHRRTESEDIDQKVESGEMVDRVVRRLAADGPRIFNLRNIPVAADGAIDGFAVYTDITERKQRERELERYETIVETIPMGIVVFDEDRNIVNVNRPGAEILGYTVDQLRDGSLSQLVEDGILPEQTVENYEETVNDLLSSTNTKEKDIMEVDITTLDDNSRILEVHTALLPYDDRFNGSVQVFHDVTERKENEQELRRQNERLEEFASIVSHDLRNPLNVAMGHLDIASQECDSDSLDRVVNALDRMEVLIGETLQLAKQGRMVTETKPLELADIAAGCWEMVDKQDAELTIDGDCVFRGDMSRIKQLLENLYRNAIDHGGEDVTINVGVLSDGFYVEDDGTGIPEDERDDIFEAGHTTSEDGTGFGLAIVSEIVDAHDWDISITEGTEGGARFEITGVDFTSEN